MEKIKKYIFVTGGVCSSLGKGIAASSVGALLRAAGYRVNMMKIDPYLNVDAGTMRPYEHGEVFVTDDGAETDLDLGNYERFVQVQTLQTSNVTTGQIYQSVIEAERRGAYLGQTVQVIPHITDEIKRRILKVDEGKDSDIVIVELGGTVGDIEGIPFIEAIRQFSIEEGKKNVKFMHLTLVPMIKGSGELKTKPTQHSVKALMSMGIQPDFLFCRAESELPKDLKQKIALFCNMDTEAIFSAVDVSNIYEVPLCYQTQNVTQIILETLNLPYRKPDLSKWEKISKIEKISNKTVKIAMVGKYVGLPDTYKSLDSALRHGGYANDSKVKLLKIDAEKYFAGEQDLPHDVGGILIPGGFGGRGIEGKLKAAAYGRKNNIPTFGICLGLQMMVIDYARNVCGLKNANSREFDPDVAEPVIEMLSNLKGIKNLGGTMRKGASKSNLQQGTLVHSIYGKDEIMERHRHRYEVNPDYVETLIQNGLTISGIADNGLVETVEIKNHPWFIGVQYHPEFKSSPLEPAPLFASFITAAIRHHSSKK